MTKTGWQWRLKISNSGTTQQFTDMNLTSFPDFTLIEECVLFVNLGLPIFSTEKENHWQLISWTRCVWMTATCLLFRYWRIGSASYIQMHFNIQIYSNLY